MASARADYLRICDWNFELPALPPLFLWLGVLKFMFY